MYMAFSIEINTNQLLALHNYFYKLRLKNISLKFKRFKSYVKSNVIEKKTLCFTLFKLIVRKYYLT